MAENKIARPIEYKSLSKGRWYEWGTISENGSYFTGPPSDPKAIHCQFTGLTDCNGVKIFEGDIVECNVNSKPFIGIIVFNPNALGYGFYLKSEGDTNIRREFSYDLLNVRWSEYLRVIGNIHEQGAK